MSKLRFSGHAPTGKSRQLPCQPIHVTSGEIIASYNAGDLRAAEARTLAHLPDGTLMDRAAAGLAVVCTEELRRRRGRTYGCEVVLLVGIGNNGGDALLAGVLLRRRGVAVKAVLTGDTAHPAGLAKFSAAGGTVLSRAGDPTMAATRNALLAADLVVDGIVGIGGFPGLEAHAAQLVQLIPQSTTVVAADLPSGVDPETGETPGRHVTADVTVAFGAFHPCLLVPPAAYATGRIVFVDVGVQREMTGTPVMRRLTKTAVAARWPVPQPTDHKYTRGVLGVVAGSDTYPGAAVLAVAGAIKAGVGIARYIGPSRVTDHVLYAYPEAVPGVGQVQAWLLGSGVEADPGQDEAIDVALGSGQPCVVDAGALEACVRRRSEGARPATADRILLTPHAGELARMLTTLGHQVTRDDIESRPLHHAHWLARETDATVLLKGSTTLVVDPSGNAFSQDEGPGWLATAGSGDVLAGIAGALLAAGVEAAEAGAMAAWVHGQAADRASRGGPIAASVIAHATPASIAELLHT